MIEKIEYFQSSYDPMLAEESRSFRDRDISRSCPRYWKSRVLVQWWPACCWPRQQVQNALQLPTISPATAGQLRWSAAAARTAVCKLTLAKTDVSIRLCTSLRW